MFSFLFSVVLLLACSTPVIIAWEPPVVLAVCLPFHASLFRSHFNFFYVQYNSSVIAAFRAKKLVVPLPDMPFDPYTNGYGNSEFSKNKYKASWVQACDCITIHEI